VPLTWFDLLLGAAIIVLLTIFATRIMDFGPDAQVPRFLSSSPIAARLSAPHADHRPAWETQPNGFDIVLYSDFRRPR